jgi:hypothetical protein
MSLTRRGFAKGLLSLFGVTRLRDLRASVLDRGRPLLLPSAEAALSFHIYEDGCITLGSYDTFDWAYRPTWRELWGAEGIAVDDPVVLAAEVENSLSDPEDLDRPVDDRCWPMAQACTWNPAALAFRWLDRHAIGPELKRGGQTARLEFHEADNHPGSCDLWVVAPNDLSATLLQAQLLAQGHRARVVMETDTIRSEPRMEEDDDP